MTLRDMNTIRSEFRTGPPRVRRERASLWLSVLKAEVQSIDLNLVQVATKYREALEVRSGIESRPTDIPHADPEETRKAHWVRIGAFAVLVIEMVLAVAISVWSLVLWHVLAGIIGSVVAVSWTLGSLGVHYGRCDAEDPMAARRSVRRGAWVSFLVGLIGLIPLLLARSVPEIAVVTGFATAVVSLGLSSLAAYLFVLAFLIDWARPYVGEHSRLRHELSLTVQLLKEAGEVAAGRLPLRRTWETPAPGEKRVS